MELKEKVVVITGASSGIGMAMATAFAVEGAHLVLAARNHPKLLEIAAQLKNTYGIQVIAVATGMHSEEELSQYSPDYILDNNWNYRSLNEAISKLTNLQPN